MVIGPEDADVGTGTSRDRTAGAAGTPAVGGEVIWRGAIIGDCTIGACMDSMGVPVTGGMP